MAEPSHEHKKCVEVKVHREGAENRITASVRACTEVSGGWPADGEAVVTEVTNGHNQDM